MATVKCIGILTSGGDAPGMNAAIRAVTRSAIYHGYAVKGIMRGYRGLITGEIIPFKTQNVSNIVQQGGTILNPSKMGGLFATKLEARYYIIIGCFRERRYAEALLNRVSEVGYKPALISFRNGMIAVGLCPVNTLPDALTSLNAVKEEPFCPQGVWILVNE